MASLRRGLGSAGAAEAGAHRCTLGSRGRPRSLSSSGAPHVRPPCSTRSPVVTSGSGSEQARCIGLRTPPRLERSGEFTLLERVDLAAQSARTAPNTMRAVATRSACLGQLAGTDGRARAARRPHRGIAGASGQPALPIPRSPWPQEPAGAKVDLDRCTTAARKQCGSCLGRVSAGHFHNIFIFSRENIEEKAI